MPPTLLLADDSLAIQRVVQLTFADEDIRVVAVSNGDQAIAAMEDAAPDIVLADVAMPGRNGYEVARHVRTTPRLSHVPVLLLTGAFEPIDQERAAAVACSGVLAKPFAPRQVVARVKELLSSSKPAADRDPEVLRPPASRPDEWGPPAGTGADSGPRFTPVDEYFDRLEEALSGSGLSAGGRRPRPEATTLGAPSSEALVEEIVRRVLERLPDTVVRAVVTGVVSPLVERLVREEVEKTQAPRRTNEQ
jgi:CheY-like chemotaxis protein